MICHFRVQLTSSEFLGVAINIPYRSLRPHYQWYVIRLTTEPRMEWFQLFSRYVISMGMHGAALHDKIT